MQTVANIENCLLMFEETTEQETKREFIVTSSHFNSDFAHACEVMKKHGVWDDFKEQHPTLARLMESSEPIHRVNYKFSIYG